MYWGRIGYFEEKGKLCMDAMSCLTIDLNCVVAAVAVVKRKTQHCSCRSTQSIRYQSVLEFLQKLVENLRGIF